MLPDIDGYEIIKAIKENNSNIPVIFMSARNEDLDKMKVALENILENGKVVSQNEWSNVDTSTNDNKQNVDESKKFSQPENLKDSSLGGRNSGELYDLKSVQ